MRERRVSYSACCSRLSCFSAPLAGLDAFGAGDQLGGAEVESGGEAAQAGVARIAVAVLYVGDPALVEVGAQRELLLCKTQLRTTLGDGAAKRALSGWGPRHGRQPVHCPSHPQ